MHATRRVAASRSHSIMDRESVVRHWRAWAEGIDPATGVALPPDHPGQQPETLRVVYATLALLNATRADAPARAWPPNAGRPWSPEDDDALAAAFDSGAAVSALATQLGRTRGAINARLVKLGKIEAPPGLRLRGEPPPYPPAQAAGGTR
jgi:hypothetical protein